MAPSRKRTAKESASEHRLRIGCFMGGFSSATIPKMPAAANEKRLREFQRRFCDYSPSGTDAGFLFGFRMGFT